VLTADGQRATVTVDWLRQLPLLQPLQERQLVELTRLFVCERASAGQVIVTEGEPGSLFYLLVRGQVTLSRRNDAGERVEVGGLGDGDQFGELALLKDAPRNATVTARTDCLMLTLTRQQFLDLLATTPSVRAMVERIAAQRAVPM
jgi:ATP-binding cassette, subfamily B, bacterial